MHFLDSYKHISMYFDHLLTVLVVDNWIISNGLLSVSPILLTSFFLAIITWHDSWDDDHNFTWNSPVWPPTDDDCVQNIETFSGQIATIQYLLSLTCWPRAPLILTNIVTISLISHWPPSSNCASLLSHASCLFSTFEKVDVTRLVSESES